MKYLLDTNIASQKTKSRPDPKAFAWLQETAEEDTFLSAVSIQEMRFGLEDMKPGARRNAIQQWLEGYVLVNYRDRILPVDTVVADECGRLMFRAKELHKHTAALADALIAATALVHGLAVVTLNVKHFRPLGVKMVDLSL